MTELAVREPSPSDWDQWIERLVKGEEPASAARAVASHLTLSAFRRQDEAKQREALKLSREARAYEADRRGEEWALADDASDQMRLAWLKRWNREWAGTTHVEVSGGMEVTNPDVAAAIDRFTALTDAAVRALAAGGPGSAVGDADGPGQGELGVPVARLDRAPEPA